MICFDEYLLIIQTIIIRKSNSPYFFFSREIKANDKQITLMFISRQNKGILFLNNPPYHT